MQELRPLLATAEAPLMLVPAQRPLLDGSVRPLCRAAILAAVLALPTLGALAADRFSQRGTHPEPVRLALTAGAAR